MWTSLALAAVLGPLQTGSAVPARMDRVTVYSGRALVERVAEVSSDTTGSVTFAIGPLPARAIETSFQVGVESGSVVVQGFEQRLLAGEALAAEERRLLQERLDQARARLEEVDAEQKVLAARAQVLERALSGLAEGSGPFAGLSFDEVLAQTEQYQEDFAKEGLRLRREEVELRERIAGLEAQLGGRPPTKKVRELRLTLFFERPGAAAVRVGYLVPGADWTPSYDVRVAPDLTGVRVAQVADVRQSTGEDWTDVEVLLSTAQPHVGLTPPDLPLRIVRPFLAPSLRSLGYSGGADAAPAEALGLEAELGRADFEAAPKVRFEDLGITAQFALPDRKTILANGESHRFLLTEVPLEVSPYRYVVPSLSDRAYLRADVTLNGDRPLLEGAARIFLGPDYLGESRIPSLKSGDSTTLDLGIDPNLSVEYELVEESKERPGRFSFSSTAHLTRSFRATLRLSAAAPSSVLVLAEEALPIARDDRISVEVEGVQPRPLEDEESQRLREERNVLRWRFSMAPGSTQVLRWGYDIGYDEDLVPVLVEE